MAKGSSEEHTGKWWTKKPEVKACQCIHEWQNKRYGLMRRLHAAFKNGWRCTVCGNEK